MIRHLFKLIWNRKKRSALLLVELTMAFLILFGVLSLVIYNLDNYKTPLGFETENIWQASLFMANEPDSAQRIETKALLRKNLMALQEVEEVCYGNPVAPFTGSTWSTTSDANGYEISTELAAADINYAQTLGLNLVEGRWFNEEDKNATYKPIVVSEKLRNTYWKDTAVIGKLIQWAGVESKIIGVIDHFKYHGEFSDEKHMLFSLFEEYSTQSPTLIIRLKDGFDPGVELTINKVIQESTKGWKFAIESLDNKRKSKSRPFWIPIVALLSISGFLIFNVALGLFGVLVYNIKKRRAEIGLRRAVGADPLNISKQFIYEILILSSISVLIGLFFAAQFPAMDVFDVNSSVYIRAMLFSALTIYSLVLICTIYPSRQASLVHPATALHEE